MMEKPQIDPVEIIEWPEGKRANGTLHLDRIPNELEYVVRVICLLVKESYEAEGTQGDFLQEVEAAINAHSYGRLLTLYKESGDAEEMLYSILKSVEEFVKRYNNNEIVEKYQDQPPFDTDMMWRRWNDPKYFTERFNGAVKYYQLDNTKFWFLLEFLRDYVIGRTSRTTKEEDMRWFCMYEMWGLYKQISLMDKAYDLNKIEISCTYGRHGTEKLQIQPQTMRNILEAIDRRYRLYLCLKECQNDNVRINLSLDYIRYNSFLGSCTSDEELKGALAQRNILNSEKDFSAPVWKMLLMQDIIKKFLETCTPDEEQPVLTKNKDIFIGHICYLLGFTPKLDDEKYLYKRTNKKTLNNAVASYRDKLDLIPSRCDYYESI